MTEDKNDLAEALANLEEEGLLGPARQKVAAAEDRVTDGMKATVEAFVQGGLRQQVKAKIGGGLVNEETRAHAGGGASGKDVTAAAALAGDSQR